MTWGQSVGIGGGYWWVLVFFCCFFRVFTKLIHISPYMLYIFGW